MSYLWEHPAWPCFTYRKEELLPLLSAYEAKYKEVSLVFSLLHRDVQNRIVMDCFSEEALHSSDIEGIRLHLDSVYSSFARKMGVAASEPKDRYASAVATVIYDAVSNPEAMTKERLFYWDTVFTNSPTPVQSFRNGFVGVYSGKSVGKEELIYEAPPYQRVEKEMEHFLTWLNSATETPIIKSAIASFWFVAIHPFGDGNGRISRALADYVLAKESEDGRMARFFSLSKSVSKEKMLYYGLLQKLQNQNGSLDLTIWLSWYLTLACNALADAEETFHHVILLTQAMSSPLLADLNARHKDILYRLFSRTFYGKLTAEKYRKIEKCSSAQATRDLAFLEEKGFLSKAKEGGRSTNYILNEWIVQELLGNKQ